MSRLDAGTPDPNSGTTSMGESEMKNRLVPWLAHVALVGCATHVPPPEHTLILAEVVQIAASDEPGQGLDHSGTFERFPKELFSLCGISTQGGEGRDLALVRFSYYWHNGGAPLRETVRWYGVMPGLQVVPGNVVEIELLRGADGADSRCPWVGRVLAEDIVSAGCEYLQAAQGGFRQALGLLSPVGAAGSASLDCPTLVADGWREERFGFYGATAWMKAPVAGQ